MSVLSKIGRTMYVCICNALNEKKLASAVDDACAIGRSDAPTVGEGFRRCGERPQCGKCLTDIAKLIEDHQPRINVSKIAAE